MSSYRRLTWGGLAALIGFLGNPGCTTPSEADLIGGLPCDKGACAAGFECDSTTDRCVAPNAIQPGSAGGTPGSGGMRDGGSAGNGESGGSPSGGSSAGGSSPAAGGAAGSRDSGGSKGTGGSGSGGVSSGGVPANAGGARGGAGPDAGPFTDAGATCGDQVQNATETAIDCGGPSCNACPTDRTCDINPDCASGRCRAPDGGVKVCLPPSCGDGIRNGLETGVDCGGGCPSCLDGADCNVTADCANRHCVSGVCVAGACLNGQRDGSETATDCGGPSCLPCARGSDCRVGSDCASGVCARNGGSGRSLCANSSCSDGVKNGSESDTDCGGGCTPCPSGKLCTGGNDCASGACSRVYSLMVCQP